MKLEIGLHDFQTAVSWAARAVPGRPAAPIVAGLKLAAVDGLTISGFDYDTAATMTTPAGVIEPGETVVPGRLLQQIASALSGKVAEISGEGEGITITCEGRSFTLRCMDPREYPALPVTPAVIGTCDGAGLAAGISRVLPAVGGEKTEVALQAVQIVSTGRRLRLTATNKYQAAVVEIGWDAAGDDLEALLPGASARLIAKDLSGPVTLSHTPEGLIGVSADGRELITRSVGMPFPNVERQFTGGHVTTLTVPARELLDAVRAAALTLDGPREPVLVALSADAGLTISARPGEKGESHVIVPAAEVEGEPLSVLMQPDRLEAAVDAAGELARVAFTNDRRPALVTSADEKDTYRHLVMPVRPQ